MGLCCGGGKIGNRVLIAANSFVDFDVPDDSLVLGNPGVIKGKKIRLRIILILKIVFDIHRYENIDNKNNSKHCKFKYI